MDQKIKKFADIWTRDEKRLGSVHNLFHRQRDINPALGLYAAYLEVENYDLGVVFYVPTDFIAGEDPETGKVNLSVTFDEALKRTWFRLPDFVARGDARKEPLPAPHRE